MPRLFGMVLRWTMVPILLLLAVGLVEELWRSMRGHGFGATCLWHPLSLWFASGIGFRFLIATLMQRMQRDNPLDFLDTLEHELTHALMGYATFCPPVSLSATLKSGGEVTLKGINPLAVLSPYFLPLWCFAGLGLGLITKSGLETTWDHFLFFLMGWFCYRLSKEFRWRQSDLHVYGFTFSTFFVSIMLILSLALILHVRGILPGHWIVTGVFHAWQSLQNGWAHI